MAVVYCDNSYATTIVNGLMSLPWNLVSIINHIRCKMMCFDSIRLLYQVREVNRAADFLAKLDNEGNVNIGYFVNPLPQKLNITIEEDAASTLYPRFKF